MTPGGAEEIWDLLRAQVAPESLRWLEDAVEHVRQDRSALAKLFPAMGRHIGRQPLLPPPQGASTRNHDSAPADEACEHGWTVDDAGRALLLLATADAAGNQVWRELDDLYRFGDASERRAVLRSLPLLRSEATADGGPTTAGTGDADVDARSGHDLGLRLVEDAIRTNDPRLIAAALNPYTLERLSEEAFNQAILKCVFVGAPLRGLDGPGDDSLDRIAARATPSLSRMLAGFVRERVAAGRGVPADVWPLIEAHPPDDEIAALAAELDHPVQARRDAAAAALAQRAGHNRELDRGNRARTGNRPDG